MNNQASNPNKDIQAVIDECELDKKREEVRKYKINKDYSYIESEKKLETSIENLSLDSFILEQGRKIQEMTVNSINRSKNRDTFINEVFVDKVDLHEGGYIIVGASTGNGKSTGAANIVESLIRKGKKAIVLTNEETTEDVFGRVSCLQLNLDFNKRHLFSEEEKNKHSAKAAEIASNLIVFDDQSSGQIGTTSTWKGIKLILNKINEGHLLNNAGVLILDYYQNVKAENDAESPYQSLRTLSSELRKIKDYYPIPIVVMVQMRPVGNKKESSLLDYYHRVTHCKAICDDATCVVEMISDKKTKSTLWVVHKNRFSSFSGPILTSWEKGRIIAPRPDGITLIDLIKNL
jgi:hypothetical protein